MRVPAETLLEPREQPVDCFEEYDGDFVEIELRKILLQRPLDQLHDGTGELDARGAAASNHECKETTSCFRIFLANGELEPAQDPVPELHSVLHRIQREAVPVRSRNIQEM